MFQQRIEKIGDELVIAVPEEEVERLGLQEGQTIGFEIMLVDGRPVLRPELKAAWDESWERNEPAYRFLADR